MIAGTLRIASLVCPAVLLLSFGFFVIDQASNGSKQQIKTVASADGPATPTANVDQATNNIDQANPSTVAERAREKRHGGVREVVDDADDVLVSPFSGVASPASSIWTQRTVPTLLALLLFGVGLRFVAGYVQRGRWR